MFGTSIPGVLLQYGLAGIGLFVESAIIMRLYNDGKLKDQRIEQLQTARYNDAREMTDKATIPLASISQTINLIYDKLKTNKEAHS